MMRLTSAEVLTLVSFSVAMLLSELVEWYISDGRFVVLKILFNYPAKVISFHSD
jgi:hypothetical protein